MVKVGKGIREKVAACCRALHARNFCPSTSGNVSVRIDSRRVLITPTAVPKSGLKAADLVIVSLEGRALSGRRRPTSELGLHLQIYRLRPDAAAVVHAHPPVATGFACAGVALDQPIASEFTVSVGTAPLAPYAMPGTPELAASLDALIPRHAAILMGNHGVVTFGRDLDDALGKMELVEHFAQIVLTTLRIGRQARLTPEQIRRLEEAGKLYGARPARGA